MFWVSKGQGQGQNAHACPLPILKACISMPDQYPHPFEYAIWEGQLHVHVTFLAADACLS